MQSHLDGTWPGWWTAEKRDQLVSRTLAEPDQAKQRQLVQELRRFQREGVPWVKCGEAVRLRAMCEEIAAYDNPTDWYLWDCEFAT
jgi:hypothetical protein